MAEITNDSTNITQRIEKLNQWQEEQRQILLQRQINQRKLLTEEQKTMYRMLGFEHTVPDLAEVEEITDDASDCETFFGVSTLDPPVDGDGEKENFRQNNQKMSLAEKPKRPFLRRKEGLTNRFKIDPDQLRLNNLPPYKFASTHPSLLAQTKKTTEVKIKSGESSKQPPPRPVSKSLLKLNSGENRRSYSSLDVQEEKFQNSLISSQTACNSTPDMKAQTFAKTFKPPEQVKAQTSCATSKTVASEPISWAAILDPTNIKPVPVQETTNSSHQESKDEAEAMSIFEMLEAKANDGSFDMNASCIQRLLMKSRNTLDDDSMMSASELKLAAIPTEIYRNKNFIDSASSDEEYEKESGVLPVEKPLSQVRFVDESVCTEDTVDANQTSTTNDTSGTVDHSEAETTQNTSERVADCTDSIAEENKTMEAFKDFKRVLVVNSAQVDQKTNTNNNNSNNYNKLELAQDMLMKADLIKDRLHELETEISSFKRNNAELVKAKQQHELEKAHFERERQESLEKLNEERVQMEIYLHDERMKLEEERKKFDKHVRTQKSMIAIKQKKEATKLREDLENLQKDLRKKDEQHLSAQGRLRAHIRNLEKDIKQLNLDIENLQKVNKRLEAENNRINRNNNNKMLHEINKNIAKLGSKAPPHMANETSSDKFPNSNIQTRPKRIARRRCVEEKFKPSPKKQIQNSPANSSTEESSSMNGSPFNSMNLSYAKNTKEKPLTPADGRKKEVPAVSTETTFKREITNADGSKDIWYPNGNIKKVSADGMNIRMLYFNKDIKETNINEGTVKYYYAETNTWHTTYLDGLEILEFPNGQTEHRYKDGKIEVHFPNNSVKLVNPADEHKLEEWRFADGTNLIQMKNGDKVLLLSNGQKEIHTPLNKRREYPDGTVKLVYPDGSQETRYSNGRVRLKDKEGNLLMDTHIVMPRHKA